METKYLKKRKRTWRWSAFQLVLMIMCALALKWAFDTTAFHKNRVVAQTEEIADLKENKPQEQEAKKKNDDNDTTVDGDADDDDGDDDGDANENAAAAADNDDTVDERE
mmetsp:Transcript_28250/g.33448  ORF Transcript_28250/g.33448 Transcript_28250/m.33448 type:complete len:109 (+) Transcript_28250:68-394(+)